MTKKITYGWLEKYADGGDISKKKSVIIAENNPTPKFKYEMDDSNLPDTLVNIVKKYGDIRDKSAKARNQFWSYAKGFLGDNPDREAINTLIEDKRYKELSHIRDSLFNLETSPLVVSTSEFYNPNINPEIPQQEFIQEGDNLKQFYKKRGVPSSVYPLYGDTIKAKQILSTINPEDDVALFGHKGSSLAGIPIEWWSKKIAERNPENCILGTCYGNQVVREGFNAPRNILHTNEKRWEGVYPNANTLEEAMFSQSDKKLIKPILGDDYEVSNKRKNGGEITNVFNTGDAIAENGKEIQYYQQGRDFKPKIISKNGTNVQMKDQLQNLKMLTTFENFNKKMKDGGWLQKFID